MITQFQVRNYKALRDVTLDLTPIHVLIGPNDSGKSSILEALRALSRAVHYPLENVFEGRWEGRELVWKGDTEPTVALGALLQEADLKIDYSFTCSFALTGRNVQRVREKVRVTRPGGQHDCTDSAGGPPHMTFVAAYWSEHPGPEQRLAREVHDALNGASFCRWVPSQLGLPVAFQYFIGRGMDVSGFGLAMYLNDILTSDHVRFGQLEERFRSLFPYVRKIQLRREPAFMTGNETNPGAPGVGIYFEMTDSADLVPASRASDGLVLVLAYLAILNSPEPPRLLLIEEPENGIHPARLEEVLKILKELVDQHSRTQVVLTTHSPYAVDVFEPEQVTLCRKGADGAVSAHPLSKSKRVREQLDVFRLGEIWTAEGDEALATPMAQD